MQLSQDRLWVARFNGGACGCYDTKTGKMLAEVRVPKEAGWQAQGHRGHQGHQVTSGIRGGWEEYHRAKYPPLIKDS